MVDHQLPVSTSVKKTCTSCGSQTTPQWREGPSGPRTLCNACGVKYLRHVRGLPRSSKHAAVHKPLKKCKQQRLQPQTSRQQSSFPKPSTSGRQKTCKGIVKPKQEPLSYNWHDTEDCSQPSSESAGEVCWAPQAEACDQEQDLLRMGTECSAAVNLLSMTNSQRSLQHYVAEAPACEPIFGAPQAHVIDNQLPGCAEPEEEALMHQHACSCAAAEFEVCIAKKEAAVADAAVAAVAKVLAAKEAAAKTAKAVVSKADRRLKQLQAQAWVFL